MPTYSIATAKEQLSRLIDEALAGEEITITREGEPVVELRPKKRAEAPKAPSRADIDWLRERRAKLPPLKDDAVAIIRAMRDDGP